MAGALDGAAPAAHKIMDTTTGAAEAGDKLDHILSDLLKLACQSIAAEVGLVALAEAETGDLVFSHAFGTAHKGLVAGTRIARGKGISGWVIANRRTALVTDLASDSSFAFRKSKDLDFVPRDLVCAPLITGERAFGVFMLLNKRDGSFTAEDAGLMESLGSLAASAIQNARLYDAEQTGRRLAQTLSSFSMAITQSLDVGVVLSVLLDYLCQLVPCDRATAMLVERGHHLAVRAVRGGDGNEIPLSETGASFDAGAIPALRQLLEDQRGAIVQDTSADPAWVGCPCAIGTRSWIGFPLVAGGRVIGAYSIAKREPGFYREEHLELAGGLASQTSAAIQSAWLLEKVGDGRARLQALSRQLVESQENERREVSRELHDEAGQALTSLKVGLSLLESKAGDPAAVREGIRDLQKQVEAVMVDLHRLASHLRPASLDQVGLSAAVQQMVETLNLRKGPRVEFEGGRLGSGRLHEFTETQLYRIIQEALSNAMRHSRATAVSVILARFDGKITAVIEDDGVGFDPILALHSGRLGLLGMRERAEMLGGSLTLESSEGKGTTVVVEVPDADPNSAR